ncbi:hypothetical protein OCGS_0753 [Oceaniovalibus guishaninsula JLT2003]|uniref:Twin-arginine translocation pathway signal n=1 Tax=Oceaniovalibus guishaninsula JLT2003 TaxID=1231392 RepID=K2HC54_9RHOB|nr:DUF1513 domain-containing protein [Oceaniovalibus guishaninsula]EKE45058.1 hypothetical protein OCGS_0753 [Oceaniovalibus guishaninsula JLT2003]
MTSRRRFLATLAATAALPAAGWAEVGSPDYLAAAREPDGTFALFGLTAQGQDTLRIPLPARGHAAAGHPVRAQAVAFARRPGTYALVIDCARGTVLHRLAAPEGHHFSGHGTYSLDATTLYTAEIEDATGIGQIGFWDVDSGYARSGWIASGGIGPHEILRLPGREVIVVANGGIVVAPDDDRTKLNIDTMRPSLSYLAPTGGVIDRVELDSDLRKNSIRHLAIADDGTVALAMQWEGDGDIMPPLLGLHRMGHKPVLCDLPGPVASRVQGYAGSVAASAQGQSVAITCPRGGLAALFDGNGAYIGKIERPDICGVSPAEIGFTATDGLGGLSRIADNRLQPLRATERAWDNHLVRI